MGYSDALEAAGATVIQFSEFGDYQGTWLAYVKYKDKLGYITGSYGSCSGCDSFQAEFDYCYEDVPNHEEKMRKFGESYLNDFLTKEEVITQFSEDYYWDDNRTAIESFIEISEKMGHEMKFYDKFDKEVLD